MLLVKQNEIYYNLGSLSFGSHSFDMSLIFTNIDIQKRGKFPLNKSGVCLMELNSQY